MKKIKIPIFIGIIVLGVLLSNVFSNENDTAIEISNDNTSIELTKKYPIKSYHEELQLECRNCHGEGSSDEYEELEDEQCLSCHKTKDYLAKRLNFMDKDKTSPHNSVHDGTSLGCYECHRSHEPSVNMCADCHNIETWMKVIE